MSQSHLTSYYGTRKRRIGNNPSKIKNLSSEHLSSTPKDLKTCSSIFNTLLDQKVIGSSDNGTQSKEKISTSKKIQKGESSILPPQIKSSKPVQNVKSKSGKGKEMPKTKKNTKRADIRSMLQTQTNTSQNKIPDATKKTSENPLNVTYDLECSTLPASEVPILKTPKRTLSTPEELSVDSKKKKTNVVDSINSCVSPPSVPVVNTNLNKKSARPAARKKLVMAVESSTEKNVQNQDLNVNKTPSESKSKLSCGNLEDLKERLQKFDKTFQKLKQFQSNKFKITSVISTAATKAEPLPPVPEKQETIPCYEKFSSLDFTGPPSLTLPFKYKVLSEIFRSSDTIVSMLHNRKERCTFEKLKSGVQDMTKRSFTKNNLGQIKTVFPSAYGYNIEKNPPSLLNRSPGLPQYQLVISPILNNNNSPDTTAVESTGEEKSRTFIQMSPSCLVERHAIFSSRLLHVVKSHHQVFLSKLNPPIDVPMEKLTKWHAKFRLDNVPDIQVASLPEAPNVAKIDTAKDVLNKLRGIASQKVERALENAAQVHADKKKETTEEKTKPKVSSGLLKGISMDLLQRIRARESAKIAEEMTTSVEDQKRTEMLERIPELVNILRTYFITERRAAMAMEDAAQRLSDSYHTALGPGEVEEHIKLMAELFPSWLTLITIRKGVFLKIDKNKDINFMLNNMPRK